MGARLSQLFQNLNTDEAKRSKALDELWAEFEKVKNNKNRLFEFHKKLRTLTFFDPACGCGNFLVISYRELRELELAVLRASIQDGQMGVDVHGLIHADVDQFYGIEIEEFPAQIAQVAMWLMDHQMNMRLSEEFGLYFARIPLRTSPHIVHGNALRLDWNEVLPAQRCIASSSVLGWKTGRASGWYLSNEECLISWKNCQTQPARPLRSLPQQVPPMGRR